MTICHRNLADLNYVIMAQKQNFDQFVAGKTASFKGINRQLF